MTDSANLRGFTIIATLTALGIREEIAKAAALVVLLLEHSIETGNVPNFSLPMTMMWQTFTGDTVGMRVQIESELMAEMAERVV